MKQTVKVMIILVTFASLVSCNLEKNNKDILFWNVDTQVDFMKADGKLYVQGAEEIEPILANMTVFAKEHNIRVVNTCDYHNETSLELSDSADFINTFPPHCMQGTEGQSFIEETNPKNPLAFDWNQKYDINEQTLAFDKARNIVIRKDLFDVFTGNPNTDKIVEVLAPKKVFVYGVATNVCVHFAVVGLLNRGYEVYVIEDGIKELPKIDMPIEGWKSKGAKMIKSTELEKYIN